MSKNLEMLKRTILVMLGCLIVSVGINGFLMPHKFLSGGIGGIALILQYVTNIPAGYYILIVNIPIFLIGIKAIDKEFGIFSLIGIISLSICMIVTKNIGNHLLVEDMIISSIYGGLLTGIGCAVVFQNRGSMGGTDIVAIMIRKKTGGSIGSYLFIMNIIVVMIGASINGINIALYTLISMYISSEVVNRLMNGVDRKKLLFVVTQKEDEIARNIFKEIRRGVTFLHGQGGYTRDEKNVIYCIVTLKQLPKMKKLIEDIDPQAFMSVLDTTEVNGKGFKKPAL